MKVKSVNSTGVLLCRAVCQFQGPSKATTLQTPFLPIAVDAAYSDAFCALFAASSVVNVLAAKQGVITATAKTTV